MEWTDRALGLIDKIAEDYCELYLLGAGDRYEVSKKLKEVGVAKLNIKFLAIKEDKKIIDDEVNRLANEIHVCTMI